MSERDERGRADGFRATFTFTPVHLAGAGHPRPGGERGEPRGTLHQAVQAGVGEEPRGGRGQRNSCRRARHHHGQIRPVSLSLLQREAAGARTRRGRGSRGQGRRRCGRQRQRRRSEGELGRSAGGGSAVSQGGEVRGLRLDLEAPGLGVHLADGHVSLEEELQLVPLLLQGLDLVLQVTLLRLQLLRLLKHAIEEKGTLVLGWFCRCCGENVSCS